MHAAPKLKVNLYVQVPPEVDELRRRLQAMMGCSANRLVEAALRALADRLAAEGKNAA